MTEAGDYIVLENQNYLLPPVVEHQNGVVKKQFKLYNGESNKHSLDLFLPRPVLAARRDLNFRAPSGQTEAPQGVPVVVFVHGGGWRRGDRRAWTHTLSQADTNIFLVLYTKYWNIYQNVGESLSRQGVACAVISYPLSDVDFPWNLIETLISWFLSTSVLLLPMLVAVLLATYFQGITSSSADHKGSWCEQHHSDVYTASILMVTGCQAITWSIIQYHRKDRYDFLPKFLPVLLVFFFITMSCVHFVSCHLYQEVLLVNAMCLIVTPAVLFYYRHISTSGKVKHPGHALAVAKAIHWVAQYGRLTKFYDPELLFLMGHSAGAHLVALVTGDRRYLEDKANDGHSVAVKGVISISGIYNLNCLSTGLARHMYLNPAFGKDPRTWELASPATHLGHSHNQEPIPYLIINAEKDMDRLIRDAKDFIKQLHNYDIPYEYHTVDGTNHFSIINEFAHHKQKHTQLEQKCMHFIRTLTNSHIQSKYILNSS